MPQGGLYEMDFSLTLSLKEYSGVIGCVIISVRYTNCN